MDQGNAEEAAAQYGQISVKSEDWPGKLQDGIRFNILNNRYQEAWRLVQLAKRLHTDVPDLYYYDLLSSTLGGVCPLKKEHPNKTFEALLHAYTWRNSSRFRGDVSKTDPYDAAASSQRVGSLGSNQAFFLDEIPKARLQKQSGCRGYKSDLSADKKTVNGFEFEVLKSWYENVYDTVPESGIQGRELVLPRILELAVKPEDEKLRSHILSRLRDVDLETWKLFEPIDRRYLYGLLIKQFPKLAPRKSEETSDAFRLWFFLVTNDATEQAPAWLGLVTYDNLSDKTKASILEHLLTINGVNHLDYILYLQALHKYQQGDVKASLSFLRRLFFEETSGGQTDLEISAVDLSYLILREYQLDDKMAGAIQSALPTHLWHAVYRRLLLDYAYAGNNKGTEHVFKMMEQTKSKTKLGLKEDEVSFVKAYSAGSASGVKQVVGNWEEQRQFSTSRIKFLAEFFSNALSSKQKQGPRDSLRKTVLDYLEREQKKPTPQQKQIEELVFILQDTPKTDWLKGSELVRSGTIHMGQISLQNTVNIELPFVFDQVKNSRKRLLLAMPVGYQQQKWQIQ
ncbi:MAG: hypothetical protein AB7T49_13260 [Oligoflexales bacterium]